MNNSKTTEELVELLTSQRKAVMNGTKKLICNGDLTLRELVKEELDKQAKSDPLYQLMGLDGLETIWTYQDYRELIQKYQVENQISSIEWQSIKLGERFITFPDANDQLMCLDSDLTLIRSYKGEVVEAWAEYAKDESLMFWYEDSYQNHHSIYCDVTRDNILRLAHKCEWAMLRDYQDDEGVILRLGWGNPLEAGYFCYPDSDNFHFHSAPRDSQIAAIKATHEPGWEYEWIWACPVRI